MIGEFAYDTTNFRHWQCFWQARRGGPESPRTSPTEPIRILPALAHLHDAMFAVPCYELGCGLGLRSFFCHKIDHTFLASHLMLPQFTAAGRLALCSWICLTSVDAKKPISWRRNRCFTWPLRVRRSGSWSSSPSICERFRLMFMVANLTQTIRRSKSQMPRAVLIPISMDMGVRSSRSRPGASNT
jgi:hypothetical protein